MNDQTAIPTWFKVVAGIALLWNLMGVFAFYLDMTMNAEAIASQSAADQQIRAQLPGWFSWPYGIAVIAGALGCVLLLMKKALAMPVLVVSFVAVLVQFGYIFLGTDVLALKGAGAAVMPGVVIVISTFLVWLSMSAKGKNWLR